MVELCHLRGGTFISPEPLVKMRNITKRFGGITALSGVNLDAYAGEVLAIVGDNGYAELNATGIVPISGGEHEFSVMGCQQLLEKKAVSVLQYDTNRVGVFTAAQKTNAIAAAYQIPVIPHAGQMHNYHLTIANVNCPVAEYFPMHDVEVGNDLFHYVFEGDPVAVDGFLQLDNDTPVMGISISDKHLHNFDIEE